MIDDGTPKATETGGYTEPLGAVVEELKALEPDSGASLWHTGGGIFAVRIPLEGGGFALCGQDGETWVADVMAEDNELLDSVALDVPREDSRSPQGVARFLFTRFVGVS